MLKNCILSSANVLLVNYFKEFACASEYSIVFCHCVCYLVISEIHSIVIEEGIFLDLKMFLNPLNDLSTLKGRVYS